MKTRVHGPHLRGGATERSGDRRGERGMALLVVLMVLFVVAAFVLANTHTLNHLKQELKLIDREQQQKYEQGPGH